MQLPHLLRKIRVLEIKKLQLRAGCCCVLCTDLTSIPILFSFLRFQLKIKSFQGLFFFSHTSPELQHLLKGCTLAPHPGKPLPRRKGRAAESSQTSAHPRSAAGGVRSGFCCVQKHCVHKHSAQHLPPPANTPPRAAQPWQRI